MPRPDSGYPADWFRIGERDLDRAKRLLADEDYPGAAFNLQQAVVAERIVTKTKSTS
jgi:HEPN domain-containing protein